MGVLGVGGLLKGLKGMMGTKQTHPRLPGKSMRKKSPGVPVPKNWNYPKGKDYQKRRKPRKHYDVPPVGPLY